MKLRTLLAHTIGNLHRAFKGDRKRKQLLNRIAQQNSGIQQQLEVLHEKQMTLTEQMYQEIEGYRRAELQEWRKSLFLDVIECVHQVETILEQRLDNASDDERDAYLGLRDMLVNTLRRRGVHSMDETHLHDRRCIRVVSTRPTNDKHLDRSLHHLHHQGFLYQDNVLYRAEIVIHRYQPSNEGD
jgi:molecular chaperone GrpE (heat shock protein)